MTSSSTLTPPPAHAKLSPSGASRWMACPGSILANSLIPTRPSSGFAEEGTAAHELASWALESKHKTTVAFLGRLTTNNRAVTQEMCDYVQEYVDNVLDLVGEGELRVEVKVDFSGAIGVPDSFGTADVVIVGGNHIQVIDLKYGRGVAVEARDNPQLMIYALGALEMFDELDEIEHITLGIHMPRKDGYNDWTMTKAEIYEFAEEVKSSAEEAIRIYDAGAKALTEDVLIDGKEQCKWCDFKGYCPTLGNSMMELLSGGNSILGFLDEGASDNISSTSNHIGGTVDVATLAKLMDMVPTMEGWIKAVRERVESELNAGISVPGFKLVRGRAGARKWADKEVAEKKLKGMRLGDDNIYTKTLISPTVAEKLLKKDKPRKWANAEELIVKPEGGITVAPESDKRPAIVVGNEFENLDAESDGLDGLE